MTKILVTGGAGFIGRHVVKALVTNGYDVISVDNFLRATHVGLCQDRRVVHITEDIRNPKRFASLAKGVQIVINLAAVSSVRSAEKNRDLTRDINAKALYDFLRVLSLEAKVPYLIHASSREVYDPDAMSPTRECAPLRPTTWYGQTKLDAERMIARVVDQTPLKATITRFSNIAGPEDYVELPRGRVIPTWLTLLRAGLPIEVMGSEDKTFDFLHVKYVVQAILRLINQFEKGKPVYEIINIGSGIGLTLGDVARRLQLHFPNMEVRHKEPTVKETSYYVADIHRQKHTLSVFPGQDPLEGIETFSVLQGRSEIQAT